MGEERIEMELTNVKVMMIQYLLTFLGGHLKVVYGYPLRLARKQNLTCKETSKFYLTVN